MVCEEIKALQDTKSRKLGIFCQMLHNRDIEASELIKVVKYLPGWGQQPFFVMKYGSSISSYSQENYYYEMCKCKDHICSPRCFYLKYYQLA